MASSWQSEAGAVTAEFVIALPALMVALGISLAALAMQASSIRFAAESFALAQAAQAGKSQEFLSSWLAKHEPAAYLRLEHRDGLLCASIAQRRWVGLELPSFELLQRSCVWVGEDIPVG